MQRQRSDLSESNLVISSTPEAESYFKRKSAAMSEAEAIVLALFLVV